jgi:hypothetical protein
LQKLSRPSASARTGVFELEVAGPGVDDDDAFLDHEHPRAGEVRLDQELPRGHLEVRGEPGDPRHHVARQPGEQGQGRERLRPRVYVRGH